jgi:hypothetical protein
MIRYSFLRVALLLTLSADMLFAQHDSSYVEMHNKEFHLRIYTIQKYNLLHYQNKHEGVNYLPHTIPGLGAGFTYDWLNVNLSYGFRFNGKEEEKGKTKYLDLQIHSYAKKFILDLFGQTYEGLYVPGDKDENGNFYHRPDLQTRLFGGSFQYILNNRRFSFRSSFLQTDWQKRSAGSVLLGVEIYVGRVRADSTLLPNGRNVDESSQDAHQDKFIQAGPTIGYAHTIVIGRHFFVTGSFAESFNYGKRMLTDGSGERATTKFSTNPSYRIMAGYNSSRWGLGIFYVNNRVNVNGTLNDYTLAMSSGTFRINYVYRFRSQTKIGELIDRI